MTVKKKNLYIGTLIGVVVIGTGLFLARRQIYRHFDYKTDLFILTLEPPFQRKVRRFLARARKEDIELRVISAYRDCAEQNKLYQQGRITPGRIVTNAPCGRSAHNYRRAVDVLEFRDGKPLWENPNWTRIGELGESVGMEWGGRWKSFPDRPHFQDLNGHSITSLYRQFKQTGSLEAVQEAMA